MNRNKAPLSLALMLGSTLAAHADTIFSEDFESPDVSATSALQFEGTFDKGQLPDNGSWIGSSQGFGADRFGMINKSAGDYTAPAGNNQGVYFGYTNSGITTSASAITTVLELGVTYTLSFDIARDNDKTESNYMMQLVAFSPEEDDVSRKDVRASSAPGIVLASVNGTVTTNDLSETVTFDFVADEFVHTNEIGKSLGIRFIGNSSHPIVDNITLTTSGTGTGGPGGDVDSDGDGMIDSWEITHFGDLSKDGTDDTDGDFLSDFYEFENGLIPTDTDSDDDGNPDWVGHLDPDLDSDGDGLKDVWELTNFGNLDKDGTDDSDGDYLTDAYEYQVGLDPNDVDSDNDGNPDWVGHLSSPNEVILFSETFENPDVSATSTTQYQATFDLGSLPSGGNWIGATQGFGSQFRGLINKNFGDYTAPSGNGQAYYFAYTNSGITSSTSAFSSALKMGEVYTLSFDIARDNDKTESNYIMELVAFTAAEDDSTRNNVILGSPGVVLKSVSGVVTSNDLSEHVTLVFTPDEELHAAEIGKWIGIRFRGDSSRPILDNVVLKVVDTDTDGDGLNDDWELLHFGDLSKDGTEDSDNDLLSDAFEFEAGLIPTDPDSDDDGNLDWIGVPGYLSAQQWDNIVGDGLSDLFASPAFYNSPSWVYYVDEAKSGSNTGDQYGLRLSGTVIAPESGQYRFWLAGGGESRLYLSSDSTPFNRRLIASVSSEVAEDDWDQADSQKSRLVELVEGQEYYIEVLMKEDTGADHVSVAWQYAEKMRHIIPGAQLKSFVPHPGDLDDDGMLDAWEISKGLDPNDNGSTNINQSGYANLDGDDLLNFEEHYFGGDPYSVGGNEGFLAFDYWGDITGDTIDDLVQSYDFSTTPDVQTYLGADLKDWGHDYGGRLRGTITAPETGEYTFYISGDDQVELWLSPNENRFEKQKIAFGLKGNAYQEWRNGTRQSASVHLVQGQSYYIEALIKNSDKADHLSIGWSRIPSSEWVTSDVGSNVTSTWSQNAGEITANTTSGDIWHTSDSFTYRYLELAGNFDISVQIPTIDSANLSAKAGLMVRESLDADSRNMFLRLNQDGRITLQHREETGAISKNINSAGSGQVYQWVRMTRVDDLITGYYSFDGVTWRQLAYRTVDYGDTVFIGTTLSGFDGLTPVDATWDNLSFSMVDRINLIPSSALTSIRPDSNDADDDNLPDSWEIENGLSPGTSANGQGQFGDPDGDSLTNYQEYLLGSNPLEPGGVEGHLTREIWKGIDGYTIAGVISSDEFLTGPERLELLPGAEFLDFEEHGLAHRVRGTLTAPVTGTYRFWMAGERDFELWLSSDSTKFRKKRIAWTLQGLGDGSVGTEFRRWDKYSSQSSEPITLEAGEEYFIEILHKDQLAPTHFSVAWSYTDSATGILTERELLPAANLSSLVPNPDDLDDDYLPDSWETQMGLDPVDNGLTDFDKQGEYGDFDGDFITNREEWLLGTNPTLADTDNDGISDYDEINIYRSNPNVADGSSEVVVSTLDVTSVTGYGDEWEESENGITTESFRGEGVWQFSVPSDGFWVIKVDASLLGKYSANETMPVHVKVNGAYLSRSEIAFLQDNSGTLRVFTSYLTAGTHELSLFFDNYMARRQIEVTGISVLEAPGADNDGSGHSDLLENYFRQDSGVSEYTVVASHVSPVFIEGSARALETFELRTRHDGPSSTIRHKDSYWSKRVPIIQSEVDAIAKTLTSSPSSDRSELGAVNSVSPGPGMGTWYVNLDLEINQATTYTALFENGSLSQTGVVVWRPVNLFEVDEITIPINSELLLGAWEKESDNSSLDIAVDGVPLATINAADAVPHLFDVAGEYEVSVVHQKSGTTQNILVTVEEADLQTGITIGEERSLVVELPGVEPHLVIDSNGEILASDLEALTGGGSVTTLGGKFPGVHNTAIRMNENGPILDIEEVTVVGVSDALRNDADVAFGTEDGLITIYSPLLLTNLPPGGYAKLIIFRAGVTFLDGTTEMIITADDLDEYGVISIGFLFPADMPGGYCHYVDVYDAEGNKVYHGN